MTWARRRYDIDVGLVADCLGLGNGLELTHWILRVS